MKEFHTNIYIFIWAHHIYCRAGMKRNYQSRITQRDQRIGPCSIYVNGSQLLVKGGGSLCTHNTLSPSTEEGRGQCECQSSRNATKIIGMRLLIISRQIFFLGGGGGVCRGFQLFIKMIPIVCLSTFGWEYTNLLPFVTKIQLRIISRSGSASRVISAQPPLG